MQRGQVRRPTILVVPILIPFWGDRGPAGTQKLLTPWACPGELFRTLLAVAD